MIDNPPAVDPPSLHSRPLLKRYPDNDLLPQTPIVKSPPLCWSTHAPIPSKHQCNINGVPYTSATQYAVLDSMATANCLHTLHPPDPANTESMELFADCLAAMPDLITTAHPDNPSTYAKAMASPDAASWTTALQEEFVSLCDLGVYKLVPHSSVPTGCKIMKGQPVFKLKCDQHGLPACFKARYVC
ncbi:hypothetical protein BDR04DRAFT_1163533 [Suillus decipiens]|nr:hypothetical protein BDR04DRAFT_1163533 [Suillus decipiens]